MSGPRSCRTQRGDHRNDRIPVERAVDGGVAEGDVALATHPGVAVALDAEQVPSPEGVVEGDVAQGTPLELVAARDGAPRVGSPPE